MEDPSCEHCGDLTPFELCFRTDGGVDWCEACADAEGLPVPTDELRLESALARYKWHTNSVNEVLKEIEELSRQVNHDDE